jgi:hypothetical protein
MNMRTAFFLSVAASVAAIACGGSDASTSPIASTANSANNGASTAANPLTGTMTALTGSCPTLTFTLERKTIKTTATTGYGDGKCTDLKNDLKVAVVGTALAEGGILATQVTNVSIVPPPLPASVPAISGAITALTGTCPAVTIRVGDKTATTTSATFFDGKGCGDLKVGTVVNIFGTASTATGSVLVATKVASPR